MIRMFSIECRKTKTKPITYQRVAKRGYQSHIMLNFSIKPCIIENVFHQSRVT